MGLKYDVDTLLLPRHRTWKAGVIPWAMKKFKIKLCKGVDSELSFCLTG